MVFQYRASVRKGYEGKGYISLVGLKGFNVCCLSTKILISEEEWKEYRSGFYQPSKFMKSLDIRFAAFDNILSQFMAIVAKENDEQHFPAIVRGAHKAIEIYRDASIREPKNDYSGITSFTDFANRIFGEMREGKLKSYRTGEPYGSESVRSMEVRIKQVAAYEKHLERAITFDDITSSFQRDFINWRCANGAAGNTVSGELKCIKQIMRIAYNIGLTKNIDFRNRGFVPRWEKKEFLVLTPEMIAEMENLDIKSARQFSRMLRDAGITKSQDVDRRLDFSDKNKWYRRFMQSRDIFLLGYYTGLRYVDYSRLCKKMIVERQGRLFIEIVLTRRDRKCLIPLDKRVLPILDRYGGKVPYVCLPTYSAMLRNIGILLGWTHEADVETDIIHIRRGGRICDLITPDTAIRSFATNYYNAGVPVKSIMAITGHELIETFRDFIGQDSKEIALTSAKDFKNTFIHS